MTATRPSAPDMKGIIARPEPGLDRRHAMGVPPGPKFAPLPVTQMEADGTFRGYASLFNRVDLGRDRVLPGAFRSSIRRRGAGGVRMLFQHDPSEVIGTWRVIREDAAGLWVEGHLSPDVAKAREVRSLMKAGALDGLSIGFHTVRARKDAATGVRSIVEADLWEISVVTFPMLPDARVAEVKGTRTPRATVRPGRQGPHARGLSASPVLSPSPGRPAPTLRDIERMLRRDAGLTRTEAKTLLARGARGVTSDPEALGGTGPAGERDAAPVPLAARIRVAASLIKNKGVQPWT